MKDKGSGDNPWRALGMVGALGFEVAMCALAGYWVGGWIGGTRGWQAGGILTGLGIGIWLAILLVKKVLEKHDE
ncbi:hypothetical protein J19TS2_23610 [Cohnella xylanilytica]|uniref:hypothetical protein n=1 Tax=Cohnella xylanilytica TaxID=557555 RepID=UPI001AFE4D88|nr:hypothetical protein [Cohnella xylanilytica]GIO12806.1 hypothetical protein J19TS2_23610 [Cohnella xylanilytica]